MTLSLLRTVIPIACCVVAFCSCARLPRRSLSSLDSKPSFASKEAVAVRINVNTALASDFEKLPAIGKALAERIVAHRHQHGPFRRAEHLLLVPGISESKFRELQALITVE